MTGDGMRVYFNEFDRFAAAWLRKLYPHATVDERSIRDVAAQSVRGFRRVHFFGGIGGWEYALQLAGWPADREVWTGSCPCQPFSDAGKKKGTADERHLWPEMFRLVRECHPPVIFGEQVASSEIVGSELEAAFTVAVQRGDFAKANKLAKRLVANPSFAFVRRWVDGIRADLEAEGYAFGATILGAHSVSAPHIRLRLYWVANSSRAKRRRRPGRKTGVFPHIADGGATGGLANAGQQSSRNALAGSSVGESDTAQARERQAICESGRRGGTGRLVLASKSRLEGHSGDGDDGDQPGRDDSESSRSTAEAGAIGRLGESNSTGSQSGGQAGEANGHGSPVVAAGFWSNFDLVQCLDGKARRIESGTFPLAHGVHNRVGRLRGYGNAIVPQVAAEFVMAFLDTEVKQ